ncbi:TetR/AcrR family transcriptional regulator [Cognatishimia activa]|uniref:TetR/AcrR family transcriptional regulator n=1 Tax=Cognatishimia activa TaxID=1715691 RepID=A0A975ESB8_9RHOB|nr:TetR/AcrR family transcriptional regulator [Cognatishimia activa]QTN36922.1 TetR/AcrR family transcriptional regulator [Cognatishimia activa]
MNAARDRLYSAALKIFAEKRNKGVSVSELAREANVARSTIYNLIPDMDTLFSEVANQVTEQFNEKLMALLDGVEDPAIQLTYALAFPLEEFHNDPQVGRFVTEFALRESQLKKYWFGVPEKALMTGIESGRFVISKSEVTVFRAQMAGGLLSTMLLIQDGQVGWREAAHNFAMLQLRALGMSDAEARTITERLSMARESESL